MVNDYESWERQGYVSEFLSLKCAGDVLNICSPLGSKYDPRAGFMPMRKKIKFFS